MWLSEREGRGGVRMQAPRDPVTRACACMHACTPLALARTGRAVAAQPGNSVQRATQTE